MLPGQVITVALYLAFVEQCGGPLFGPYIAEMHKTIIFASLALLGVMPSVDNQLSA